MLADSVGRAIMTLGQLVPLTRHCERQRSDPAARDGLRTCETHRIAADAMAALQNSYCDQKSLTSIAALYRSYELTAIPSNCFAVLEQQKS